MAVTFRLADYERSETFALTSGTLNLRRNGWRTVTPSSDGEWSPGKYGLRYMPLRFQPVVDTLALVATGTESTIRTAINSLMTLVERVRLWHSDPTRSNSIWLEAASEGETVKRALIYDMVLEIGDGDFTPLLSVGGIGVRLVITRHPLWESLPGSNSNDSGAISCWGGVTSSSAFGLLGGDVSTRIGRLQVQETTGDTYELWAGIRPSNYGVTNWVSTWELESGSAGTDTAASAASDASNGSEMRCTFATTASMAARVTIAVSNVITTASVQDDAIGRYLVLLRCKTDAGTVGLRLYQGIGTTASDHAPVSEEVYITNTAYKLIPLGEIVIPPFGFRALTPAGFQDPGRVALQLRAEVASGAPSKFDMDALAMVPAEHMIYARALPTNGTGTTYFITHEDDSTQVIGTDTAGAVMLGEYTMRDFYWPIESGSLYVYGQGAAAHVLTNTITLSMLSACRYRAYHG